MSSGACTVNTVLIDLSGTIHIEDTEIPGSVKALERSVNHATTNYIISMHIYVHDATLKK